MPSGPPTMIQSVAFFATTSPMTPSPTDPTFMWSTSGAGASVECDVSGGDHRLPAGKLLREKLVELLGRIRDDLEALVDHLLPVLRVVERADDGGIQRRLDVLRQA